MTSPSYEKFNLVLAQATLFASDADLSPNRIARDLPAEWRDVFTGTTINLGVIDGVPDELPTLILDDASKKYRAEVASGRLNILVRESNASSSLPMTVFSQDLYDLWSSLRKTNHFRTGRIAAIAHRMMIIDDPGLVLAQHFCKSEWHTEPFNRPANFELHAHKQYAMPSSTTVNSWVRCKTAVAKSGEVVRPAIFVEQDINTPAEGAAAADYGDDAIRSFFDEASCELENIIKKYFPRIGPM